MSQTINGEHWPDLLPKVDLHVHLDGSVKAETIMELSGQEGVPLPAGNVEELLPFMQVDDECASLTEYLSKFHFTTRFLQSAAALERVAYETVEQAAASRCCYIEVRFAPQLHRLKGMAVDAVVHHVLEGLRRGERQYGVTARAIAICMRHHTRTQNLEVVESAAGFMGHGMVAVDLAGDEASYPPQLFRDVFAASHKRGMPVTIHAGEAAGAGNIREAVENLGADRIGHGVRLKEDDEVMDLIVRRGIPLEMCPVSNIQTKAVSGWDAYPIREYFDRGVPLTVNTDNPSVSGTTITKEYRILAEKFAFTPRELASIAMNGADAAFLDGDGKRKLKATMRRKLSDLGISGM